MKTFTKFKGFLHGFFDVDEHTKGFGIEFTLALLSLFFLAMMFVAGVEDGGVGADVVGESITNESITNYE